MPEATAASAFDAESFLKTLTKKPGVYRMIGADGEILYVGKARNLKNRVTSYFRASGLQAKTMALVAKIADIQVTVTQSETEALLLEQSLIKQERPPYNIVLRDDKSYPYIYLTEHKDFPRLTFHRGRNAGAGGISAHFRPLTPYATVSISCRNCSACGIATTATSRIDPARVCNIRSSAAARPVWG